MTTSTSESRAWGLLGILVVAGVMVPPGLSRPQALRVSEELDRPDHRWEPRADEKTLIRISGRFRESRSVQTAVMEVLKGLPEQDLRVLERVLAPLLEDDEVPQADMPAEDAVEDSPQELQVDDGPGAGELAGYRGELLVLDSVNSSNPFNSSEPEEPLFPQMQKINRENVLNISLERLKEMRLATIKNQIMNILWPEGPPPSLSSNVTMPQQPRMHQQDLLRAIADKFRTPKNPFTPGDVYTEKIQSFYPSCEIPRNTDAELWNDNRIMNLLYDLSYPSPLQGTQVNIVAAKLRLYKLSQGNMSLTPETCPPSEHEDAPVNDGLPSPRPQFPSFIEDKMIRVSVFWYTRSLKKHRVKRKLLDSQMLSVYGESWTEWNIRGAVKAWRDSGRNFGLAVEVEDEDGTLLPTDKYFAPMNCSQEASTSRPIPGFLVARALTTNSTNHTFGAGLRSDTLLFPMIDLCTIEFPESEKPNAVYYHKVDGPESKKPTEVKTPLREQNTTVVSQSTTNDMEKHKIRHHNHKELPHRHLETVRRDDGDSIEEITWADDLDGHQLRKQIIVQKVIRKNQNNQQDNER